MFLPKVHMCAKLQKRMYATTILRHIFYNRRHFFLKNGYKMQKNLQIAGVMAYNLVSETASVNVCVNLGSGYLLMSQHTLDSPKIGTSLEQMGSE